MIYLIPIIGYIPLGWLIIRQLKLVDLINFESAKKRVIFPIIMIEWVLITRLLIFGVSKFYLDDFESPDKHLNGKLLL